jgi:hypothetical protein
MCFGGFGPHLVQVFAYFAVASATLLVALRTYVFRALWLFP